MRWKVDKPKHPKLGETRHVRRFLLWPKTINGETRWLEVGCWVERYQRLDIGDTWIRVGGWIDEATDDLI